MIIGFHLNLRTDHGEMIRMGGMSKETAEMLLAIANDLERSAKNGAPYDMTFAHSLSDLTDDQKKRTEAYMKKSYEIFASSSIAFPAISLKQIIAIEMHEKIKLNRAKFYRRMVNALYHFFGRRSVKMGNLRRDLPEIPPVKIDSWNKEEY